MGTYYASPLAAHWRDLNAPRQDCNLNAHGLDTKGDPLLLGPGCSVSSCPFGLSCRLACCACLASLPVLRPRPAAAGHRPIRPVFFVAVFGPTYAERDHGRSPSAFFGVPGQPCSSRRGPPARPTAENRKLTRRLAAWGVGGDVVFSAGTRRVHPYSCCVEETVCFA